MRTVTGIELGVDSCVLARVRPGGAVPAISAVYGLGEGDWNPARTLAENLREVRRAHRFPRRARVVAWGLHESASLTDAVTKTALGPLMQAGFVIDSVLTPPQALALLARLRPRPAGRDGAAWLALNRQGAAIAIVHGGELLFSRVFGWNYRPPASVKAELLQRYSLVAHLAPELRHGFEVVRADHGATVNAIVTCGDLPDLRSLTMPLTEELDLEVETLDTLEGLRVGRPARPDELTEMAPAIRLASAAAIGTAATRPLDAARTWMAAAALVLIVIAAYALAALVRQRDAQTPVGVDAPRPEPVAAVAPASQASPPAAAAPLDEAPSPRPPAERRPPDATKAEATMGRQDAPLRSVEASRPRRPAPARAGPVPLRDPLPVVNSILVAPDRRLAVVNGEIVREGQAVGARVLIRIEPDAVVLRDPSGYEVRVPIRRKLG